MAITYSWTFDPSSQILEGDSAKEAPKNEGKVMILNEMSVVLLLDKRIGLTREY